MKLGTLISYNLTDLTQPERNRLCRKLYGWKDKSQYSKYTYYRKGLLDEIPHLNPTKSVVVVRKKDSKRVLSLLRKYNVKVFVRDIILKKSDLRGK